VTLTDKTPVRFYYKYEEERRKTLIDKLNKLYVAHTRAGNELHIITEKEDKGNYSKFLKEYGVRCAVCGVQKAEGRKQKAESRKEGKNYFTSSSNHHITTSSHHHITISHTTGRVRAFYPQLSLFFNLFSSE
jgi:ATP-dependent exoDNAse (exonuclease V) beta subunit